MSPTPRASAPEGAAAASGPSPCLRLRVETVLVPDGDPLLGRLREESAAVAELSFDYPAAAARDLDEERRARYLLESLGALELACLDQITLYPGSTADYIIRGDGNVHGLCSFTAYAVPQLRALGWRVELPTDYPYQVVAPDVPWYAHVADDEQPGWFNFELGIEVDGRRVNLLPALLDLLQSMPPSAPFERLTPGGRSFALPTGDNQYVTVPPQRLRILVKVLSELYQGGAGGEMWEGPVRFPAARAGSLGQLDAAFAERTVVGGRGALIWTGATALADRARGFAGAPAAAPVPGGLRATLRPYQQDGLAWLQHLRAHAAGGVLADDMGLGKTLQTIAHLVAEKEAGRLDAPGADRRADQPGRQLAARARAVRPGAARVLVLHGAEPALPVAAGSATADVVLTTYPLLVRDDEALLASRRFSMLILDEAQAIKNPRSQAHRAAPRAAAPRHRLCLTGTPVENHLGELWALFDFLMPGLLGDADWFAPPLRACRSSANGNDDGCDALRDAGRALHPAPHQGRGGARAAAEDRDRARRSSSSGAQRELYESVRVAAHAEVRQAIASKGLGGSTDRHPRRADEAAPGLLRSAPACAARPPASVTRVGQVRRC